VHVGDEVERRSADQLRGAAAGHRAKPRVGVEDHSPGRDGGGAFVHRLDDEPVGAVGAHQGVDLLLSGRADHQRVDSTAPDRLDRLPRLAQLSPQLGQLGRPAFPGRLEGEGAWASGLGSR
jgi:hypothetical protein